MSDFPLGKLMLIITFSNRNESILDCKSKIETNPTPCAFLSFFFRITKSLPGAPATPRANLPKSERRPGFCKNTLSSLQTQKGITAALEQLAALGPGGDVAT